VRFIAKSVHLRPVGAHCLEPRAGPWEEGRALGERASPIALGDAHGKRWRALPGR